MKKVAAVKLLAVSLVHCNDIFPAFENFNLKWNNYINLRKNTGKGKNLIKNLWATPDKVPLSGDGDICPRSDNIYSLVIVCIPEDDERDPERTYLKKHYHPPY